MVKLLMIYGVGGNKTQFELIRERLQNNKIEVAIVELPGFEGREIKSESDSYLPFLRAITESVKENHKDRWYFYGHGFGAAILLEFAARSFELENGLMLFPEKLILHSYSGFDSILGPAQGLLPKLSKTNVMAQNSLLRNSFFEPDNIPSSLKESFLNGFVNCSAYPFAESYFNEKWYDNRKYKIEDENLFFVMGEKEKSAEAKSLIRLKGDFPNCTINLVKEWSLYPMLEFPNDFADYLIKVCGMEKN